MLRFRPSGRTVLGRLKLTFLCVVFMALAAGSFGFPPGSYRVARAQQQVQRMERTAADVQARLDQARRSDSAVLRSQIPHLESSAAHLGGELDRRRTALTQARPTLGRAGDALYWTTMGLLALVGLIAPLSAAMERVGLHVDERGILHVRRRGQVLRSRRYDPREFAQLLILVDRVVVHTRGRFSSHTDVQGWRWRVVLCGADVSDLRSRLEIWPELEETLPPQVARLTPRVRQVVEFCQAISGLEPRPPVITDVVDIQSGPGGTRWRVKSRTAGPVRPRAVR